jgi:hypothetical protein
MTSSGPRRTCGWDWAVPLFVRSLGRCLGRPVKHDVETWRVIDDWPARVPVAETEAIFRVQNRR